MRLFPNGAGLRARPAWSHGRPWHPRSGTPPARRARRACARVAAWPDAARREAEAAVVGVSAEDHGALLVLEGGWTNPGARSHARRVLAAAPAIPTWARWRMPRIAGCALGRGLRAGARVPLAQGRRGPPSQARAAAAASAAARLAILRGEALPRQAAGAASGAGERRRARRAPPAPPRPTVARPRAVRPRTRAARGTGERPPEHAPHDALECARAADRGRAVADAHGELAAAGRGGRDTRVAALARALALPP